MNIPPIIISHLLRNRIFSVTATNRRAAIPTTPAITKYFVLPVSATIKYTYAVIDLNGNSTLYILMILNTKILGIKAELKAD